VVPDAHCPAFGVNVYVSLAELLTNGGDQLPVILLLEIVGKTGAAFPEHIGAIVANIGIIVVEVTSIIIESTKAQKIACQHKPHTLNKLVLDRFNRVKLKGKRSYIL